MREGYVSSLLNFANDFLMILFIMAMLLIIEPTGASIALLLFGIFGLILFYLTKSLSARWGETRQKKRPAT